MGCRWAWELLCSIVRKWKFCGSNHWVAYNCSALNGHSIFDEEGALFNGGASWLASGSSQLPNFDLPHFHCLFA